MEPLITKHFTVDENIELAYERIFTPSAWILFQFVTGAHLIDSELVFEGDDDSEPEYNYIFSI